jgi:hypothetical protein
MKFIFKNSCFPVNLTIIFKKREFMTKFSWIDLFIIVIFTISKYWKKKHYSKGNVWNVTQHRKLKNFQVGLIGISSNKKSFLSNWYAYMFTFLCEMSNFCQLVMWNHLWTQPITLFFLVTRKKVGKSIRMQH